MTMLVMCLASAVVAGVVTTLVGWRIRWLRHPRRVAVPPRNVRLRIPGRSPIPLELVYAGYRRGRWHWLAVSPGVLLVESGTIVTASWDWTPPRTSIIVQVRLTEGTMPARLPVDLDRAD